MAKKKSPETTSGLKNTQKLINDSGSVAKGKKKPRGKPFTSKTAAELSVPFKEGDDPRRHTGSRYNKDIESVRKEYMEIFIVRVSEETNGEKDERISKMQKIVDKTITLAMDGEQWATQEIFNRVCGKAPQTVAFTNTNPLNDSLKKSDRDKEIYQIIFGEEAKADK